MPVPSLESLPVEIDRQQAFLLYAANCGDVEKTAHALGIPAVTLLKVVDEESWVSRLGPIMEKMKSHKPGDLERGINRALNFVQAHRLRLILERAVKVMTGWTDAEMQANLLQETCTKMGSSTKLTTRWAADFATALEKCHSMTYQALNDTASERVKRKEESTDGSALDLHARIAAAMGSAGGTKTPRGLLFDAQLEVAADIAQKAAIPKPPVDDTYEPDEN